MPVLNVADVQIPAYVQRNTTPALTVKAPSGQTYYIDAKLDECPNALKVKTSEGLIYTLGASRLYFSASVVNSCETVNLEPGCYHVEIVGGTGGNGGGNSNSGATALKQTYDFIITENTTATIFLGGNGNDGSINTNGSSRSGGGGGASGTDSMFQINNVTTISYGGAGGRGGDAHDSSGNSMNACGGGGGYYQSTDTSNGKTSVGSQTTMPACGSGGGGSMAGIAGTGNNFTGSNATQSSGGAGGSANRLLSQTASGGAGGATVSYSCGGQTLYTYGGGGGGALVFASGLLNLGNTRVNGGAGGSGASSSTDGYIMIYRFG